MLNMSLKTNEEIVGVLSLWPQQFTFANYQTIFTDRPGTAATSIP
jgi:glycerol transport system permease protein